MATTIQDVLGVQFDTELLLKLSLSVAVLLLVSWAYRVYSSRDEGETQVCAKDKKEPENAACQNHEAGLRRRRSPECNAEDGSKQCSHSATAEGGTSESTEQRAGVRPQQAEEREGLKGETLSPPKQAKDVSGNISFGSVLNLPQPTESGPASTTGRRSPCFLEKLEGTVGVGRELRQDLEHQGAYSSFLSKAEIKVKDANVVLQGTGDQVAQGKIYDYYVESSSHSITDSNNGLGHFERNAEPEDVRSRDRSLSESPSSLNPINMRNLFPQQSNDEHPRRPAPIRKESYLSAAENSMLFAPSDTSSTQPAPSLASTSNQSTSVPPVMPHSTDGKDLQVKEGADLVGEAGSPFLDIAAKTLDGIDLDTLKSKLDLSNCLQVLHLAKKHGQTSMQQAVLEVMSDSYLQVLRDPSLYGQLLAGEQEQIQKQRMRGRRFLMVADIDPLDWARNGGDSAQRKTSGEVHYYDDYKNSWHSLCLIPQEVVSDACAMCTMDNYLFVAVGCQGADREATPSKQVFCFNPLTSIWTEICPMNEARPRCKLAALEGYIYAIGGEGLNTVERYDPQKDRWTFVAPLPRDAFAVAHHVTVSNGELFVSGGTLRYMLLRYSPQTDTWRPGLVGGGREKTMDMVSVGRCLYRFDVNSVLGISVYRYHTVARLWYECCCKRLPHCPAFRCATMDDTIYCVSSRFTMRFDADEISPAFTDENLSVLPAAKGILFPFVLSLPDKTPQQTRV